MKRTLAALAGIICLGSFALANSPGKTVTTDPAPGEPPVFTSSHHLLNLLVIAEPSTITLGDRHPVAWVFEMCKAAVARNDNCPPGAQTFAPYGGIRLQLYAGDHLRMRLINHLPPAPADAINAHGSNRMMSEMLAANPVNIHTHGMIVSPRRATAKDPTWGDYIYVLDYPAGKLPAMVTPDLTATDRPLQYDIYIPRDHPPGLYWFHPHVHGLMINQLTEGLSGIITVGRVTDYVSAPRGTIIPQRFFILKDMQVMGDNQVVDQEDSTFCEPMKLVWVPRNGTCQGRNSSGADDDIHPPPSVMAALHPNTGPHHFGSTGADYTGGIWYFTINGEVYPQIPAPSGSGELWRLLNAGASRTYDLVLRDDQTKAPIPFQVVSLDGGSLGVPAGTVAVGARVETAATVDTVPCPDENKARTFATPPVCATHLVMFPSARAEIWVAPQPHPATLLTEMVSTGPAGDRWPEVSLAHIAAAQPDAVAEASLLDVRPITEAILAPQNGGEAPVTAASAGGSGSPPLREAGMLVGRSDGITSPPCTALPPGYRRRIFFGVPASNRNAYGLGYEEVDENDHPVPGTFQDIEVFDPSRISVCLPLGKHNRPVTEEWELVNVSGEAHNFHMHQTKFYVLPPGAPRGDAGRLMDNVALPNGGAGCDGTVASWRAGRCKVTTVVVRIPFSEAGDFVYHCHIGEHQDTGMMAHIRVVADP